MGWIGDTGFWEGVSRQFGLEQAGDSVMPKMHCSSPLLWLTLGVRLRAGQGGSREPMCHNGICWNRSLVKFSGSGLPTWEVHHNRFARLLLKRHSPSCHARGWRCIRSGVSEKGFQGVYGGDGASTVPFWSRSQSDFAVSRRTMHEFAPQSTRFQGFRHEK